MYKTNGLSQRSWFHIHTRLWKQLIGPVHKFETHWRRWEWRRVAGERMGIRLLIEFPATCEETWDRWSCSLCNYQILPWGPQKFGEVISVKLGLLAREAEFSVGRGGLASGENKRLICHRTLVPHKRFGKTAQHPHPVSHIGVKTSSCQVLLDHPPGGCAPTTSFQYN